MAVSGFECIIFFWLINCTEPPKKVEENVPPIAESHELDTTNWPVPEPKPVPTYGHLSVLPSTFDFGSLVEKGEPKEKIVVLQNTGNAPLNIKDLKIGKTDFISFNSECTPQLKPSESCKIRITAKTDKSGIFNTDLSFYSDAQNATVRVPLTGFVNALPKKEIVQKEPEPEPQEVVLLAPKITKPSNDDLRRRALLRKRYQKDSELLKDASLDTSNNKKPSSFPLQHWKMKDEDYSHLKAISKNTLSFPVDRCRTITEDRYIRAGLENSINSMIGGRVVAVVTYPVLGSDCDTILIPQGSRFVGEYEPVDKNDITRLEIRWRRVILNDGSSTVMDFETSDVEGKPGAQGVVDYRLKEKYGTVLFVSGLSALLAYVGESYATNGGSAASSAAVSDTANSLGNVTASLIEESTSIKNVIRIPKRAEIQIIPTTDLWFPEAKLVDGPA